MLGEKKPSCARNGNEDNERASPPVADIHLVMSGLGF